LVVAVVAACVAPNQDVGDEAPGAAAEVEAAASPEADAGVAAPSGAEDLAALPSGDEAAGVAPVGQVATPSNTLLERHDLEHRTARFDLPGRLDEISGLAFSPAGRLFAHDDERGRVHEIDPETGEVMGRFDLGPEAVRDDFEGIAIAGERFFLISSRGLLYEFLLAAHGVEAPYRRTDTGVGAHCEVEGLDYDARDDALLIACKVATPDRGTIVVHRLPLRPDRPRLEPLVIDKSQLGGFGLEPEFDPSGIAVDPTGTLILISGRHEAIMEVDRTGRVLAARALSQNRHPQTEGVAFGPDGTLWLADERNGNDARLTAYARVDRPGSGGGAP